MIETGMHRDGITKELFLEFYKNNKFKKLLKGVCTHIYNVDKYQKQYEDFKEIIKEIKFNGLIHFKASSTLLTAKCLIPLFSNNFATTVSPCPYAFALTRTSSFVVSFSFDLKYL